MGLGHQVRFNVIFDPDSKNLEVLKIGVYLLYLLCGNGSEIPVFLQFFSSFKYLSQIFFTIPNLLKISLKIFQIFFLSYHQSLFDLSQKIFQISP